MSTKGSKGVLRGNKFSMKHSTFIPEAVDVLLRAKELEAVSKVVLGKIKVLGCGPARITFSGIQAGLKMVIRGPISVQEFFVYTKDKEAVEKELTATWNAGRR